MVVPSWTPGGVVVGALTDRIPAEVGVRPVVEVVASVAEAVAGVAEVVAGVVRVISAGGGGGGSRVCIS